MTCKYLSSNKNFIDIFSERYSERQKLLKNTGFLEYSGVEYPNLDFISDFKKYLHVGNTEDQNDCLCNINLYNNPIKVEKLYGSGKMGKAYQILHHNQEYILKIISNVRLKSYLSVVIHSDNEILDSHLEAESSILHNMLRKQDGNHSMICIEQDPFQNQTMINFILSEILNDGYVKQLDAYYCKDSNNYYGYNIMEIANLGDIQSLFELRSRVNIEIDDKFIEDMIRQVLKPLSILKDPKYGFCHNDLKIRNIFVKGTLKNPIYLLADFDKSSIFWNKLRFCNTLRSISLTANIGLHYIFNGFEVEDNYYMLKQESILGQNSGYIMYSWIPMFMSHDVYTFIVSILLEPIFWDEFNKKEFPIFRNVLEILFENQVDQLLENISNIQYQLSIEETFDSRQLYSMNFINNILSNYRLKINIDNLYNYFGLSILRGLKSNTSFVQSDDSHICVTECNKECNTNTYSKTSWIGNVTLYRKDSCQL